MKKNDVFRLLVAGVCMLFVIGGCEYEIRDTREHIIPPMDGQICDSQGICGSASDLCGEFFCNENEICIDGTCSSNELCATVNCPPGRTCLNAVCIDDECLDENNVEMDCGPGRICSKGQCLDDGCMKDSGPVECDPGFECVMGECAETACLDVKCLANQTCIGGDCIDNACIGKECPDNMVCAAGNCVYEKCRTKNCGEGQICTIEGECTYESKPELVFTQMDGDEIQNITTSEAGKSVNIPLTLSVQPSADVRVKCLIDVEYVTEVSVDCSALVFTPDDWNSPHDIVITGMPDHIVDGDQQFQLTFMTESEDRDFNGLSLPINVVNLDIDTASLVVESPRVPMTSENGTSVAYRLSLSSQPTDEVTVNLSILNTDLTRDPEASVQPATLVFTPDNWNIPQTVVVTGNDDGDQETGSHTYYLVFSDLESEDKHYDGVSTDRKELTNLDNDFAAAVATPPSIVTDESGASATIDMFLTVEPTADVTFSVIITDTSEASVEIKEFTIQKSDWHKPVYIVVTGVADNIIDEDQPYEVIFRSASEDPAYNDKIVTVHGINKNINVAGFTYVYATSPEVHEIPESKTEVEIALTSKPDSAVTIRAVVLDDTELAIEGSEITIEPEDWNKPHILVVTGVSDHVVDGDQITQIRLTAESADLNYQGYSDDDLSIKTIDDDVAGLVIDAPVTVLSEDGGVGSLTFQLSSKPDAPVTIDMTSTDSGELRIIDPTTITIQPEDWNKPVTVWFVAVDDKLADGTQSAQIEFNTSSADSHYNGLESTASFSIIDDEQASIVLATSSNILKPGSYSSSVTARLSHEPTDTVVVKLITGDEDMAHLATKTLVFTPENWNIPQEVAVTTESLNSANNFETIVPIFGIGLSECDAYNGIKSNTLDFLVYTYSSHEYSAPSTMSDECVVVFDTLLPGKYKLQVWGASGGDQVGLDQTRGSHAGLGGYAEGVLTLSEKTEIFIHVGGQGRLGSTEYGENAIGGGCNGGGGGTVSVVTGSYGYGGGGASDIRIGSDTYYHRVIVAGGGGGAEDGAGTSSGVLGGDNDGSGGFGGGLEGGYGYSDGVTKYKPGNQRSGYRFGEGQPVDINGSSVRDIGGGGGGWFGGLAGKDHNSGGSGGSGYVFTSTSYVVNGYQLDAKYHLTNARLISGDQLFPSVSGNSEERGHQGGGFVRITLIEY